ncbi:MAG: flagellin FliC3 [Lachnospiraceae bacterium]|nr:flagellin FliC3 [Lachnospiraceae bacterium]
MRINYNVSAMTANNSLKRSDNALAKSLERLSSGFKINRAKDNASGLAIAKRMHAQLEGLSVAGDNANDGVSVVETADGALGEIHDMLQRISELAVKGANGTMSDGDRKSIEEEIAQLKEGIEQIVEITEFNGQKLLDGSFDLKGYTNNTQVKVDYYSDTVTAKAYEITALTVNLDADGNITDTATALTGSIGLGPEFPAGCKVSNVDGNVITISDLTGFEMRLTVQKDPATPPNTASTVVVAPVGANSLEIDITGYGDMSVQIGANEGQTLDMRIPFVSLKNIGIADTDFTTQESCKDALGKMDQAVAYISGIRSRLGAYQNRLESTVDSLDVTYESMTAAYSRIMDTDMSKEMTEYTNLQVLTQAGTSMLAQANERPSQVLQLLQ